MKAYYEDESVVIYNADCRDLLPLLPKVDLVLTDPPYGINYRHDGGGGGAHHRRNTSPIVGDAEPFQPYVWTVYPDVILWGANHYATRLTEGRWLIWDKLDGVEAFDNFSDVEVAWRKGTGKDRIFRYMWKGICRAGENSQRREHPSQKPLALMRWCLLLAPDAQVTLDPYMGVGTTLVAAKQLGRKAIGIEIEERYCEIAARRCAEPMQESLFQVPRVAEVAIQQDELFNQLIEGE